MYGVRLGGRPTDPSHRHGVAHPEYRPGRPTRSRYLKNLPPKLVKGMRAALEDAKLMVLTDEVALLQSRVQELLRQLHDADAAASRTVWQEIADLISLKCRASLIEHRRSMDLGVLVDAQEALSSYRALLDTVKHVVEDRIADRRQSAKLVAEIADRLHLLLPGPNLVIENSEAGETE